MYLVHLKAIFLSEIKFTHPLTLPGVKKHKLRGGWYGPKYVEKSDEHGFVNGQTSKM